MESTSHSLIISVVSAGVGFTDVLKLVLFLGAYLLKKALIRDFSFPMRCVFNSLFKLPHKCTRTDIIDGQNSNNNWKCNITTVL